ncbi:MAG: cyclic nucleotide-binding domain-containing protein [Candidatus Riflebacteria bacterium]|nr:cyclic nucleotide-binding domain-containing protein [Candidatus Riflebacteria bacterium]
MSIEALKLVPLFSSLDENDLKKIAAVVKEKTCPANTYLFREGDRGDTFYVIKKGGVEVLKKDGDKEKCVAAISATDKNNFFGELALVEGAPRNASVKTATETSLFYIDKTDFDMLLRLNSFIALSIMQVLTKRIREEGGKGPQGVQTEAPKTPEKLGKFLVVFSPKGGSGKSVFAANMASGLSKMAGAKVLLIDQDLQFGDQAFMLGLPAKKTIAELVEGPTNNFDVIKEFLIEHKTGFFLLPAPKRPEQSETINSTHLRSIIETVRKHFDYIILDTHSLFQDLTIHAMDMADLVFLLFYPVMTNIKSMVLCLQVIGNLKYAPEKLKIVLNREGANLSTPKQAIQEALKRPIDFIIRDDFPHIIQLVENKLTVFEQTDDSSLKEDFTVIVESVSGKPLSSKKSTGIFKSIKSLFGS